VVVDLAAESGGNVEGTVAGQEVHVGGVRLVGMADAASTMPVDASRLYAKNLTNLLALMVRDGALALDLDDEVLAGTCVTHDGVVRHEPTRLLLEGNR
jgi:NAD(P) transhydrogenase subunit alpha